MKARRIQYVILLLASLPLIALSNVFKQGTPTRVQAANMTIRWETSDESAVTQFVVLRREYQTGGWSEYYTVGSPVAAKGQSNSVYQFVDDGVFKSADRILEYEIRAIAQDGHVIETVSMSTLYSSGLTSAAKRTWGSIKAMFR
jgi:hypothetical protein